MRNSKLNKYRKLPKYPTGSGGIETAGIKLSAEEVENLRSLMKDPEAYRSAIWEMMGYEPKRYPAGSDGWKQQMALYNEAVAKINAGYAPNRFIPTPQTNAAASTTMAGQYTAPAPDNNPKLSAYQAMEDEKVNQMIDSSMKTVDGEDYKQTHTMNQINKQYAKGTKAIEVQRDETIFRKIGNKFKLVADFIGGKTHKQGGEPYVAQAGDVIFPGHMRDDVMKHYNSGDHSKLESMRKDLPPDTSTKYEDGTDWVTVTHASKRQPKYEDVKRKSEAILAARKEVPRYNANPYQSVVGGKQYEDGTSGVKPEYTPYSEYEALLNNIYGQARQLPSAQKRQNQAITANNIANLGVGAFDLATSIDQISRSNRGRSALNRPSRPDVQNKDPRLQMALYRSRMRANQGLSPQTTSMMRSQDLDNFLKAKDVAQVASAGQASAYGSMLQKSILDRYKNSRQLGSMNEQAMANNNNQYLGLLDRSMQEDGAIYGQRMGDYADRLQDYRSKEAAIQHLGQTGRVNLRKTIGDFREMTPRMYNTTPTYKAKPSNSLMFSPDPVIRQIINDVENNTRKRFMDNIPYQDPYMG